jgi:hypothetical protein
MFTCWHKRLPELGRSEIEMQYAIEFSLPTTQQTLDNVLSHRWKPDHNPLPFVFSATAIMLGVQMPHCARCASFRCYQLPCEGWRLEV